jgi:hypothetical protein
MLCMTILNQIIYPGNIHYLFIFPSLLSYYCCTGGIMRHLQKVLQYIIVGFTIVLLILLSSIPRIVTTDIIFPFSYMSAQL